MEAYDFMGAAPETSHIKTQDPMNAYYSSLQGTDRPILNTYTHVENRDDEDNAVEDERDDT